MKNVIEKTIKVTGVGIYKVEPNMQSVVFCCEIYKNTYEECLSYYNEKNKKFSNDLIKIGVDGKNILTTEFNINENYEYYTEKTFNKSINKRKLINYELTLEYKIVTEKSIKIFGEILGCFNKNFSKDKEIELKVNIQYFNKDNEKGKKEAISLAVKNCIERAKLLAENSSVKLGDVLNIDYSWNNIVISSLPVYGHNRTMGETIYCGCRFDKEINVKEIEYKAEVNMIYEMR